MGLSIFGIGPKLAPESAGGGQGTVGRTGGSAGTGGAARFMQLGDARALSDRIDQELTRRGISFMNSGPQKKAGEWTIDLTVSNKSGIDILALDDKNLYKGLKVNITVDESLGLQKQ